ncbi:MAG: ribose 5-phosphate isomerase B [Bacteroidota bacterium]|nr:ribose 5-phosphate isomerase B [Bacteroidota bacterium]
MKKKIALSCDHAGYKTKEKLKDYLVEKGFAVEDFGTYSIDSCDYPDFAHPMANSVENGKADIGISICGSGNGINMAANKHQGIRSALCWKPELAELARLHNDANICALPARFVTFDEAKAIVEKFLNTGFEGGRHINRINKIPIV